MAKRDILTAKEIARKIVTELRRESVGRRPPTDDDWMDAIERAVQGIVDHDTEYQDGYDDGYDEGYEDGRDEVERERETLRHKKRQGKKAERGSRQVIRVKASP